MGRKRLDSYFCFPSSERGGALMETSPTNPSLKASSPLYGLRGHFPSSPMTLSLPATPSIPRSPEPDSSKSSGSCPGPPTSSSSGRAPEK